jgi:hypothetical protein
VVTATLWRIIRTPGASETAVPHLPLAHSKGEMGRSWGTQLVPRPCSDLPPVHLTTSARWGTYPVADTTQSWHCCRMTLLLLALVFIQSWAPSRSEHAGFQARPCLIPHGWQSPSWVLRDVSIWLQSSSLCEFQSSATVMQPVSGASPAGARWALALCCSGRPQWPGL